MAEDKTPEISYPEWHWNQDGSIFEVDEGELFTIFRRVKDTECDPEYLIYITRLAAAAPRLLKATQKALLKLCEIDPYLEEVNICNRALEEVFGQ